MAKSLKPAKQICVNVPMLIIAMIIFAIVMFFVGWATVHYPLNGGLI